MLPFCLSAGDVSPQDYVGQDGNENGGTSNHRGTCSRAGDVSLQEYVDQSEDENGVASNPRGTGSRYTRQLLEEIRQKKRNFSKLPLFLFFRFLQFLDFTITEPWLLILQSLLDMFIFGAMMQLIITWF